jgi:hypothetical protein
MLNFFAVRGVEPLPCPASLPCFVLHIHGKEFFVVRRRTALFCSTAATVFPVVNVKAQFFWVYLTMVIMITSLLKELSRLIGLSSW